MIFRATDQSDWHHWFAWYPLRLDGGRVWLERIWRRREERFDRSVMDMHVTIFYRTGRNSPGLASAPDSKLIADERDDERYAAQA